MTEWRLVRRSLAYHWRMHAAVVGGAAIATAVLVGALLVGASVRTTLRGQAHRRIGAVQSAVIGGDRFFTAELADRVGIEGAAAVLQLPGVAMPTSAAGGSAAVQVCGVDERFWALAMRPVSASLAAGEVAINRAVAGRVGAAVGDEIVLRLFDPGSLPRDAALGGAEEAVVSARARVVAIVGDEAFGAFALYATPEPASNVFVSRQWLGELIKKKGRANILLERDRVAPDWFGRDEARASLQLSDYELSLRDAPEGRTELRSERVFLDEEVARAVAAVEPAAMRALTYFVNALRKGERATPYSTVAAVSQPNPLFEQLGDDQIVINTWLAEDLGAAAGDAMSLRYFVMDDGNRLTERVATFVVAKVVALEGLAADASLMPVFPGLHDSDDCRDWTPGIPVDLARIRDKDEAYWDAYRGTPKAFVTLATGQRLWGNRFGSLTAVRFAPGSDSSDIARQLVGKIDPMRMGLAFTDVRASAMAAAGEGTDFASLFLGLSFFLIVAALLLTALLFTFNLERRASEAGLLLAVGWTPGKVRGLFLGEATMLAVVGGVIGAGLGVGFTAAVLRMLSTIWRGAVAGAAIELATPVMTMVWGVVAGVGVTLVCLVWVTRRLSGLPGVGLLAGETSAAAVGAARRGRWIGVTAAAACGAGAVVLVAVARRGGLGVGGQAEANTFFAAGGLMLLAGVSAVFAALSSGVRSRMGLSLAALAWRGATRRRGRSLAVAGMLACGLFLVMAVGATQLRLPPPEDAMVRATGTGGFALHGRTSLPLLHDLNSPRGREALGLDEREMRGVSIVPLRVSDGDDASCLNLNRAQRPRLMGVDPKLLASRGAFTFMTAGKDWRVLAEDVGEGLVAGVVDRNTLMWGLHAAVGDMVRYTDERGEPFDVKIIAAIDNSILQGELIISEAAFVRRFPSISGWRAVLVDAPAGEVDRVSATLSRAMEDIGLVLTPAGQRLAAFNAVENTFRMVFQTLGALGLLLGCAAVGAVVMRNVLERRGELAILSAVGFAPARVRRVVVMEHAALVAAGLVVGTAAAAIAAAGSGVVSVTGVVIVAAVGGSAMVWVWVAMRVAMRGTLIDALRTE